MKNKKIILKMVLWAGVFAVFSFGYFYFSGPGSGSLEDGSVAIIQAGKDMLGNPPAAVDQQDSEQVALGDSTSDSASDSGNADSSGDASGIASTDSSGNTSISSASDVGSETNSNAKDTTSDVTDNTGDSNAAVSATVTPVQLTFTPPTIQACSLSNFGAPSSRVILNEIAWMGSLPQNGETGTSASNREWIELKNISSGTVDLSGWQILDSGGGLKIVLGATSSIPVSAGGFYLLVRGGASLPGTQTDAEYSGSLSNAGDELVLFDPNCGVSDNVDATAGWPGGNNTTKQTLERDADGIGWHTSAAPGGTPRAENSVPATPSVVSPIASSTTASLAPSTANVTNVSPAQINSSQSGEYTLSVSSFGSGSGVVSSSPSGIFCGFNCAAPFDDGTKITLTEAPEVGSVFKGWTGACVGVAPQCSFAPSSATSVIAEFDSLQPQASSSQPVQANPVVSNTGSAAAVNHVVIAAIQIGSAAASSNDFVKLYNPTSASVDMSGWKLHKKSSTGTDYSLRTFPTGSAISPGEYFVWANSEDGFADSIGANVSSTETLSADNSVALLDANGNPIDQVAWGTGANQYIEGNAYPTDPTAGQVLTRQNANGSIVDTDNNASDFGLE